MTRSWCPRCGVVRYVELPAWCRHYAPDQPAEKMVPLPTYHPLYRRA